MRLRHSPIVLALLISVSLSALIAAQGAKPQSFKGLEMTVAGVERTAVSSLRDCPPGANTVKATTKPGEEFAVVSVAFKVTAGFKEAMLKRPVLTDAAGKVYNTAVSFIDPASVSEYTCAFPFRVPTGTKLKSVQIEGVTLDLSGK
jgi:hypothetical protein